MALNQTHIKINGRHFPIYYLCKYQPRNASDTEGLSESLLRFKAKRKVDVEAWTECACIELTKIFDQKKLLILRALGAKEITINQDSRTALDWMGRQIAHMLSSSYEPERLSKTRQTKSLKTLTKTERENEMDSVYQFDAKNTEGKEGILILDDITTSGTTLSSIFDTIRMSGCQQPTYGFTLAHTDYQPTPNKNLKLETASYTWNEDEWSRVAEPQSYYGELEALKKDILNGFSR